MRKFLICIGVAVLSAGGAATFLATNKPKGTAGVRFPVTAGQRELLSSVPADAAAFALVPGAAAFHAKLASNPVTREAAADWSSKQRLPRPWMLGGADLVIWRRGNETSYAVRLDALRAVLVRIWLLFGPGVETQRRGGTFVINATNAAPMGGERLDQMLAVANGMPAGDAVVVQQERSRGAFPPIGRPAVTVIQVNRHDIILVSRSFSEPGGGGAGAPAGNGAISLFRARFAQGALIAAHFAGAPRVAGDFDRLFGARLSHLLESGGSVVLYDVDTRRLLPRPDGLFVAPATAANRDTVRAVSKVISAIGQVAEGDGSILIALDKESLPAYRRDTFVNATQPASDWAVRLDPRRLVPVLEELGDNTAMRLATPRLYRSIRDLRGWIRYLSAAEAIEAEHTMDGGVEELQVRITGR